MATNPGEPDCRHIVVVGNGIIGMACAAVLARNYPVVSVLGKALPAQHETDAHRRVYALNHLAQKLLSSIGVWDTLQAAEIYPYHAMHVFDGCAEIHFDATELAASELGFIIKELQLRKALSERLRQQPNVRMLHSAKLMQLEHQQKRLYLSLSNGRELRADLVIGADGSHSAVRGKMGFSYRTVDYRQHAFIATVEMRQHLRQACYQWFHADGILALLPISHNLASIVWSCNHMLAAELEQASDTEFGDRLNQIIAAWFSPVLSVSTRLSFPLYGGITNRYTARGVALVGDAAHCIHPLAGQGANMGFADIDCLRQTLASRDLSYANLRRYERAVKGRNAAMKLSLESIKYLFASRMRAAVALRRYGLRRVNRCLPLKTFLMRQAAGLEVIPQTSQES